MQHPPSVPAEEPIRLTRYSHGAGCGCKIAPAVLNEILKSELGTFPDPRLLVGYGTRDDAAVYDMGNGRAVISTTDFFSPIVDDAFDFGRIAATNALSDVYAMGGTPLLAVAILGWPVDKLPAPLAAQVLEGGRAVCHAAGIALAGGHSIDAPEPFFGLAVTGEVQVSHIKRNDGAQAGDALLLTKPIGTGILSTAQKRGLIASEDHRIAVDVMCSLNDAGTRSGELASVHAMTDVTGFGLGGHLLELCDAAGLAAEIDFAALPVIPRTLHYLAQGCYPDGAFRNWRSFGDRIAGASTTERMMLLADPQTSGGLLLAVDPAHQQAVQDLLAGHGTRSTCIGHLRPQQVPDAVIRLI
ncbi:MAG: selenide, water dikinase SelD [Flavobacteriales bacterium]|jgi:selenide,water dikinase|nr:selenide, water dikinase SelD [Flavobacteriales bacterium]